eukprot:2886283-Prymnesium_polylepis.1
MHPALRAQLSKDGRRTGVWRRKASDQAEASGTVAAGLRTAREEQDRKALQQADVAADCHPMNFQLQLLLFALEVRARARPHS